MARQGGVVSLVMVLLLGACLPAPAAAGVLLSTLPKALAVTASPKPGQGACLCYHQPRRTLCAASFLLLSHGAKCSKFLFPLTFRLTAPASSSFISSAVN
jgi:hypothetical protein